MATDQDPGIPTELEQLRQEVARLRDEAAARERELGACQAALAAGMSFAWASWGYGAGKPTGSHKTLKRCADISRL